MTEPDVIIAHNDAAPYNAVWDQDGLVGFVDWDMAGPRRRLDDLAWMAFSWVPLHASHVVAAEGFEDLDRRRARLDRFLGRYAEQVGTSAVEDRDTVLTRIAGLLRDQSRLMHRRAADGDETYARMIAAGRADDLEVARSELADI